MKFSTLPKALSHGLIGSLGLGIALCCFSQSAKADNILLGSDYLLTPSSGGTSFDFGGPIGIVTFKGVPLGGFGPTDSIIERQQNAIFDDNNDGILERTSTTIPIEMTALSLISVAPVDLGGDLYDVLVQLNATPSTGTMTINHNFIDLGGGNLGFDDSGLTQGTFTSLFDVNFDALFNPVSTGTAFSVDNQSISLINQGADWSHFPGRSVRVRGAIGDQAANCHAPSNPFNACKPVGEPDGYSEFFTIGPVTHAKGDPGFPNGHETIPAPEPLTILGASAAIAFGAAFKKKRRQSK